MTLVDIMTLVDLQIFVKEYANISYEARRFKQKEFAHLKCY